MESPLHGTVLGSCRFVKYAVCKDYRTGISNTSELLIIPKDVDVLPDDLRKALVDDLNVIKMSDGASYDIKFRELSRCTGMVSTWIAKPKGIRSRIRPDELRLF
jgi:hypothetical protein